MNEQKATDEHLKRKENLRNFDLTVDEIRLQRTIDSMTNMVRHIEDIDPYSARIKSIRSSISALNEKLEELRDNTLIR
jgi:hypothetical protein